MYKTMVCFQHSRKWIALLLVISCIFLYLFLKLNINSLLPQISNLQINMSEETYEFHQQILPQIKMLIGTSVSQSQIAPKIKEPVESFGSQDCKNYDYRSLWNQTINSFDPLLCTSSYSTEKQFWIHFTHIFQEENFRNITCQPRTATPSKTPLVLTALASFPGSGNTWTRHLIEQLTGIQTASIYCDPTLSGTLKGECMKDRRMAICTKTHNLPSQHKNIFKKAVLIIRDPFEAVISFFKWWNLRGSKMVHTANINATLFNETEWTAFSSREINQWKSVNIAWMKDFSYPVAPLVYENLLHQDTFFKELFKLSQFLNTKITYGQLWCIWKIKEGKFHRKPTTQRPPEAIELYSPDVKTKIFKTIAEVDLTFQAKFGQHLPFANYK